MRTIPNRCTSVEVEDEQLAARSQSINVGESLCLSETTEPSAKLQKKRNHPEVSWVSRTPEENADVLRTRSLLAGKARIGGTTSQAPLPEVPPNLLLGKPPITA